MSTVSIDLARVIESSCRSSEAPKGVVEARLAGELLAKLSEGGLLARSDVSWDTPLPSPQANGSITTYGQLLRSLVGDVDLDGRPDVDLRALVESGILVAGVSEEQLSTALGGEDPDRLERSTTPPPKLPGPSARLETELGTFGTPLESGVSRALVEEALQEVFAHLCSASRAGSGSRGSASSRVGLPVPAEPRLRVLPPLQTPRLDASIAMQGRHGSCSLVGRITRCGATSRVEASCFLAFVFRLHWDSAWQPARTG